MIDLFPRSEHFQANHDEETQKLCWGWTVCWKITIHGRKWISYVWLCDYSWFWFCFWHTLWYQHRRNSVECFSTFLSQFVLLTTPNLCLRHVAIPSFVGLSAWGCPWSAGWSARYWFLVFLKVVSWWSAMETGNLWSLVPICWEFSTLLEDT